MARTSKSDGFSRRVRRILPYAVLALPVLTTQAFADPLGRLFTTSQQRLELDALRQAQSQGVAQPLNVQLPEEDASKSAEPKQPADTVRLRGLVRRSDGQSTAWINDTNTFEGNLSSQYLGVKESDIHGNSVNVTLPDSATTVKLKVGESYDPVTKQVSDLLPPGDGVPATSAPRGPVPGH